jgi:thiamine kinase-like enzyme
MMQEVASAYPDEKTLKTAFFYSLRPVGMVSDQVSILRRQPNIEQSIFPSEVLTCQTNDGKTFKLLYKHYDGSSYRDSGYGHRNGVLYEGQVYRDILRESGLTTAFYFSAYNDPDNGANWLFIQYLDNAVKVSKSPKPGAMKEAAQWIGRFHAQSEPRLTEPVVQSLTRYDKEYYAGWADRTVRFAERWYERFPWIQSMCEDFVEHIPDLLSACPTIIHGEYTPKNTLVCRESVYPVDWESTAVAAGEIDLAFLTDRFDNKIVEECTQEYKRSRWRYEPPYNFESVLHLAKIYTQLRWLGDWAEITESEELLWRFEQLYLLRDNFK